MISPDLVITLLVGSLCAFTGFVAYWRGVNATECRLKPRLAEQQAQIEQILSSQRRIEGRLDAIERQTATVAAMAHTHTGVQ